MSVSKTALLDAVQRFDVETVRSILKQAPALREVRSDKGWDLLQICCARSTADDEAGAGRQLRLAQWLVRDGFDPSVTITTKPGEDGEADAAVLSLVFLAVARARNNRLVRFLLKHGVKADGLFAATWWANWEILDELVRHGADINTVVGTTPLHMAVSLLDRGVEGKPDLARRRLKTLKELLRLGADPRVGERGGATPLQTVLDKGYSVEVFTLLLEHGADPDAPGRGGRTVREIASRKKDKRYLEALG
jgi:hypothetical protein